MTIKMLRKITDKVPNSTKVNFVLQTKISKEDLAKMKYSYPYALDTLVYDGYDIGYSDNTICILLNKEYKFTFYY